jgi:polar amino acid transport system substrate-binding protein
MGKWTWLLAVMVGLAVVSSTGGGLAEEKDSGGRREPTLSKIARTGTFVVGTQPDAVPFSFHDKNGEWGEFSVDLVRMVHRQVERELGRLVELKFIQVNPATRISRLLDGTVDMIAEIMTYTRERDRLVDFSVVVFVTGQQMLVRADSRIARPGDLAGKRIGADRGSTSASTIQKIEPRANLVLFDSASQGFQGLRAGRIDAYTSDGVILAGLKATAGNPEEWQVVGDLISYEPYAFAVRENDSRFRDLVNHALMEALHSREYIALYNKWLGPSGLVPYPIPREAQNFLLLQAVPPS